MKDTQVYGRPRRLLYYCGPRTERRISSQKKEVASMMSSALVLVELPVFQEGDCSKRTAKWLQSNFYVARVDLAPFVSPFQEFPVYHQQEALTYITQTKLLNLRTTFQQMLLLYCTIIMSTCWRAFRTVYARVVQDETGITLVNCLKKRCCGSSKCL